MKFHKYFIKTKWLKVCDLDSQDSGINSYDGELPQFFVLKVITLMKIEKAPQRKAKCLELTEKNLKWIKVKIEDITTHINKTEEIITIIHLIPQRQASILI